MAVEPLLSPLAGTWLGTGTGEFPGMSTFPFEEEVRFVDIGTRDLLYVQRAWDPASGRVLHAEAGTWRATADGVLAATIAQPRTAEVAEGTIADGRVMLRSTSVGRAANAMPLVGTRRSYRLSADELSYEFEMTTQEVTSSTRHLMGRLRRVAGLAEPEPSA